MLVLLCFRSISFTNCGHICMEELNFQLSPLEQCCYDSGMITCLIHSFQLQHTELPWNRKNYNSLIHNATDSIIRFALENRLEIS
jgi:hypothetical protein